MAGQLVLVQLVGVRILPGQPSLCFLNLDSCREPVRRAERQTLPVPFTDTDLLQLEARGVSLEEAERQLLCFRDGFAAVALDRPATVGDGIEVIDDSLSKAALAAWSRAASESRLAKFVPASGAASRMFQFLLACLQEDRTVSPSDGDEVGEFLSRAREFAFAGEWREALESRGLDWPPDGAHALRVLLTDAGLGLAQWPKGLIPFHAYDDGSRSAFAEHLHEAACLVADAQSRCAVHFTVTSEAREPIREHLQLSLPDGFEFALSDSLQEPATDTLAVDLEGSPLRDASGALVFRPGGHGALLHNLGAYTFSSGREVLLIKNIDNVAREEVELENVDAHRALVGVLVLRRAEARDWFDRLQSDGVDEAVLSGAEAFCRDRFYRNTPVTKDAGSRRQWLIDALDRPTRVCGMVRNEGEPGGGPFWVRGGDASVSLQLVESSQVAADDEGQVAVLKSATHFSPVDLACAVRSFADDTPYDLDRYVDPSTGFISRKSKDGVSLLALERPGLWNGAMAHWNTVFVEVPAATFNPVKTVLDLLRPAHRG
jgi:Domain of unknown function (DUF4301)